jgi:acetyltransferase-like isoleucine patch superfamily enzyme
MSDYSPDQLRALGFESVGEGVRVSRDARFFAVSGALGDGARIDAFAVITGHVRLGRGVHVSPFCFLGGTGGTITLRDGAGLSSHVSVFTKSDDYQDAEPGAPKITGSVYVGENAIVGSGSVLLPGVTVGDGAKIGCACVVGQSVPAKTRVVSRGIGLVPL